MKYRSKSYKFVQLIFASIAIGAGLLLTESRLPLLSKFYPQNILWIFISVAVLTLLNSFARLKFHAFLVHGVTLSLPLFFLSWYFRPAQILGRFDTIKESHFWILWRSNVSNDRYVVSWFFFLEASLILAYAIFAWRMKTKDCDFH